ncbi:MAG: amino acid-binding protein [Opitutaceae bacterium]|jgi:hypothetical protein|nr:amino acid-binding protein [Opitutaceae bacterium]
MLLKQVTVFLENKPGALSAPCRLLADAGVNIQTFALADSRQFGLLRLVVAEWEKAVALLAGAGFAVKTTDVLALEMPDRPGGLAGIFAALEKASLNVEYTYAFTVKWEGRGLVIFSVNNPAAAVPALKAAGISIVAPAELLRRLAA